jgi:uncharacterized protein involved in exopolysaccharide biosynthesis
MENNKTDFNSFNIIVFLLKKAKTIIAITTLAAIAAIVVSFMITPKYKSSVVFFPSATSSISKALLSKNLSGKYDITELGAEEQAEQLLQIINSDEIRGRIVEKYNLIDHYEIKRDDKYVMTKLYKEYEDNIKARRTEFMSINIDVLDKDPQMAADIANDIAALVDSAKNRMQRERALEGFLIVEAEYNKMVEEIKEIEDSLTEIRKLGVNDYESQSEVFNQQYAIALASGNERAIKALEQKLEVIAKYGTAYTSMSESLEFYREKLSELKTRYDEAKVDAEQNITHKFVVNKAYPAEKKTTPVRWLIVVASTIAAFLLSVFLIIIVENVVFYQKQLKEQKS